MCKEDTVFSLGSASKRLCDLGQFPLILGPHLLLGSDWMRRCLQFLPVVKFSFIVEFQGYLKDPGHPL